LPGRPSSARLPPLKVNSATESIQLCRGDWRREPETCPQWSLARKAVTDALRGERPHSVSSWLWSYIR